MAVLMFRFAALLILLALATPAHAEDAPARPSSLHYKMTVTVETPDGIKTGSAVRNANAMVIPKSVTQDPKKKTPQAEFDGEAVTIDLGKQGLIFAMVDHTTGYGLSPEQMKLLPADLKKGVKITVPDKNYPDFARFDDMNDPLSRKGVDQTGDLKITGVTLELTDEPVTHELDKHLTWVPCLARWPAEFLNQAKHGRPLFHMYRKLNAAEYEGIRNLRDQRIQGAPKECTEFWHKMFDAFAAHQDLSPVKECEPGDDKCNPFDTPENRALFGKNK